MPRTRPARPCGAHRKDGHRCGNYAIVGGQVCRKHGGAAPQVRAAAHRRVIEGQILRGLAAEMSRCVAERERWEADRRAVAGRLLGIAPNDVTRADLVECYVRHGRPELLEEPPAPRRDRRYGPRRWAA